MTANSDNINMFGTPLTESDLVINQNMDYSNSVISEKMEFSPIKSDQNDSAVDTDENPDTVADFGHHPLLDSGDVTEGVIYKLEVIPRSDPMDIPPRDREDSYPSDPNFENTPPIWRGRHSTAWLPATADTYESPRAPVDDGYRGKGKSNLRVQMQVPRGRDRRDSFTMPNLTARVVFALAFLTTPGVKTDLAYIPPTLLGRWKVPIRRLIKKHRANPSSLSVLENRLIRNHQGFQYLNVFWSINKQILSRRMVKQGNEVEMAMITDSAHYMANFCLQCEVLHANGADQCNSNLSNGPRLLRLLALDPSSYKFHQGVFVGHVAYYHQPIEFRANILNLSSNISRPYYVPNNAEDLTTEPSMPASLGLYLSSILALLGPSSRIPIFVEFYKSPLKPDSHLNFHLLGFARLLKNIQAIHKGPVVMVVPTVMPLATPPGQDYWTAKKDHSYLSFAANVIGAAVGTPVGLTFMQDLGGAPENHCFWEEHWTGEPILNERGGQTREFFKRLAYWMRTVSRALRDDAELPDELAAQEVDILIRKANEKHFSIS
jgi:hypothetical protein